MNTNISSYLLYHTHLTQGIFNPSFLILRSLNNIFVKMLACILGNFSTCEHRNTDIQTQLRFLMV